MRSLRQIYNPALFQGSLKKKNYFEGWYFKHVSADTGNAFAVIPGMECNHGVLSAGHCLEGEITVNGQIKDYSGGRGYIEKDWGTSFPECWIWLQCNNFGSEDVSVMISVAKIPWRGSWFMGFISFLRLGKRTEIFATYNRAKIIKLQRIDDTSTEIILAKDTLSLKATITKRGSGTLKAPSMGLMDNFIKESLNSELALELKSGNKILFSGKGMRAGYEETEKIFSYFTHHTR